MQQYPMLIEMFKFCFERHGHHMRESTGLPYFHHLVDVTSRVAYYCLPNKGKDISCLVPTEELLCAAMGHDLLEDTETTYEEIAAKFNVRIAYLILECTRTESTGDFKWEFLQSFKNKSLGSIVIKIADRYCNVMDYSRTPGKEKYASYYALQAIPLVKAFRSQDIYIHNVFMDIDFLNIVVRSKIQSSIYADNELKVKEILDSFFKENKK